MKLGLSQRVESDPGTGERRDCLDQQWARLLESIGYCVVPIPNRLRNVTAFLEEQGFDGILLTGGNDLAGVEAPENPAPERDATEAQLIDWAVQHDVPLLGVCRGMQMLAAHFGTKLEKIEAHVAVDHEVIRGPEATLPLSSTETTNSYHHYGIDQADLAGVFCVEALDHQGKVEALRHRSLDLYGIMWHPERGGALARDLELFDHIFRSQRKDDRG